LVEISRLQGGFFHSGAPSSTGASCGDDTCAEIWPRLFHKENLMPASSVAAVPAAASAVAQAHSAARLSLETDRADVHEAYVTRQADFVLLDVRGPKAYARSHVPGAHNLPHREITPERMSD
jgi:hypothetical protein